LNRQEVLDRAARAQELLAAPAFTEVLGSLEVRLKDDWASTPIHATELRERIYLQLNALYDLRAQVQLLVDEAQLAKR
jgi:hypothetical protein